MRVWLPVPTSGYPFSVSAVGAIKGDSDASRAAKVRRAEAQAEMAVLYRFADQFEQPTK